MTERLYPHLFSPLRVRNLILKNRIMSAPNMLFQTVDGRPNDYYIGYLEHKARGGAAVVTLGEATVCDGGNHTPMMEMTHDNRSLYGEMAAAIHEHGAVASVELTHGGQLAKPFFNKDKSRIFGPSADLNFMNENTCREMTREDMELVARAYADATEYYLAVGFDTVLIHAGHGWLLTQFLSPFKNRRTDEYGGSLENRMRFPLYVFQKVRERVGPKQALSIRVSGSERVPGGFTTQDIIAFLERAQAYIDFAEVSTEDFRYTFGGTYMTPGQNVAFAEEIKKSGRVRIPIFTIGSINRPEQAEEIIASGKADGVSMSRALIADPYLPKKAALGRADEIRPCLRCSTCTGSDNQNRHFVCAVNPLLARESRLGFGDDLGQAKHKRRVLVVGGGPAGITAAVTAARRGHDVRLVEKEDAVGGFLRFSDTDSLKHDVRRYKEYLVGRLARSGARVTCGAALSDDLIADFDPAYIIAATGSLPLAPDFIPGYERTLHATEAYFNPDRVRGERVAIIGGGLIGVETGLHLSNLGKSVTVLEMRDDFATDAMPAYKWGLELKIEELGLTIVTSASVTEIGESGVLYEKKGIKICLEADTILYAIGMKSCDSLYFDLQGKAPFVTLVGDAKRPGKLCEAVHSGFFAAMDIGDI